MQVSYPQLRAAERRARKAFPGALAIKAIPTLANDEASVHVEIRHSPDRAKCVPVTVIP